MSLRTSILQFMHRNSYNKAYEVTYKAFDCLEQIKVINIKKYNAETIKNYNIKKLYTYKHLHDRIINPCYIPNGEFKETTVEFLDKPDLKVAVMKTRHGFYIQPRERFYKFQFEEFFGLGCGNIGFDEKKTVFIPFNSSNF